MNMKDQELVELAKKAGYYEEIEPLEELAESNEAKNELHNIKMQKYRNEEFISGNL